MINTILFSLLALFWGGSFIAIKYVIHDIPSFTAAFYRVFFALIFLGLIYIKHWKHFPSIKDKQLYLSAVAGLCSIGIPFSLLFWGEKFIKASLAGVINGTVPFWTMIIGLIIFRNFHSVTRLKVGGLFFGLIGISCIFGPKISFTGNIEELKGLAALVGMAVFYALGINYNRAILTKESSLSAPINLFIQHMVSALYLGAIMLLLEGPVDPSLLLKTENALSIFYLSFISTTLAFIIFFKLIREMGAIEASSVTFFVPAVALILDVIIYKSVLTPLEALGTGLIFMSMFLLKDRSKLK